MKRSTYLLSLITAMLLAPLAAPAQIQLRVGPRVGINFANALVDPDFPNTFGATQSTRIGVLAGGAIEAKLAPMFYVEFDAQYVQKGTVVNYPDYAGRGPTTTTFAYDYIEFPILAKVKFGEGNLKASLFAGPNIGANISAQGNFKHSSGTEVQNYADDISNSEIALDAGAGIEYRVSDNMSFVADARYSYGLTDIDEAVGTLGPENWHARDFKVAVGLMVDIWQSSR